MAKGKREIIGAVIIVSLFSMFLAADTYAMGKKPEQPKDLSAPAAPTSQEVEIITPERPSRPEADLASPSPVETMPQDETIVPAAESDKAAHTREIQSALKNAGFDPGPADGVMGRKTKRAVREFQAANGLKVDGKVGPKTWAALQKYLGAAVSDTTAGSQ